jgi:hypothetical protein
MKASAAVALERAMIGGDYGFKQTHKSIRLGAV